VSSAMIVHRSNRLEALVDALAGLVAEPAADPFAPECVVVQGRGMGRWLAMELARRLGVWANAAFPFPRKLIEDATAAVLGDTAPRGAVVDPETLRWAIAEMLPRQLHRSAFAPIRRYLSDDARGVKRIQLAGRIADLFDQYAVFRPQMVHDWEAGADGDWQAELWRELVRVHGSQHASARARALLSALAAGAAPAAGFPQRVSLFGLSTLPPLYVQIFAALAERIELHLYVLSPSREYWGAIRSRRDTIRALTRRGAARFALGHPDDDSGQGVSADDRTAEANPLLASLGRVGRDFQHVLEDLVDYQDDPCDRYVDPAPQAGGTPGLGAGATGTDAATGTMLAVLQSDILALRWRGAGGDAKRLALRTGDDSIAVHACHGPMREVEVLHDQLLALFDRDETLAPQHVIVMTPSIDAYAPVIEAVFGSSGRPSIPFRIADRRARAQHEVTDAFLHALELLEGRLPAPAVVDLLGREPVRERFAIGADDLDRVRLWVAESGIRWGADASHRAELGQPACADHTWRFGLDRLLLGYALPGGGEMLFGGVLPYDDVEGSDGAVLGRLAEFCAILTGLRDRLREPRHPAEWRDVLGALLGEMIAATAANAHQHVALVAALDALAERATAGGFTGAIDLGAMRALVEREVERAGSARGFLTGAVTFCELVPMRTIPFRVVGLLGLNDGAFPRARRPLGFDRIAAQPRPGDRTARDDDRYLFLEALLAARQRLLITYVGQSISDNSELPPSVVINELLDAVDQSFVVPAGGPARAHIVQRHPLQPFSPRYFGRDPERRLFSYADTHYAGAVALVGPSGAPPPLLAAPLAADPLDAVAVDDLVRFFANPSRWFLQRRLGVYLGGDAELLAEREPLELSELERWKIGDALLQRALRGGDPTAAWEVLRAGGMLPLGSAGRCAVDDAAMRAAALAEIARGLRGGDRLGAEPVDLDIDGMRLTGVLRELWPGGQVAVQYAKVGGRHELDLWIRHLVRDATSAPPAPSLLIGRARKGDGPSVVRFAPVDEARRLLAELLHLFELGQRVPLPLFKRASRAFADAVQHPNGGRERAWAKARDAFAATGHGADGDDPYIAELYGKTLPCDVDGTALAAPEISFADLALMVFAPLLRHREEGA